MTATNAVVLMGAGPGDPELLTLAGERALAAATLVVTDAQVAHLATELAPEAEVIDGGIAELMERLRLQPSPSDRRGRAVRLYWGDAWLHPSFAGERKALVAGKVPFEVVPGIAVELGALASAGIPAHHRPLAVTLTIAAFRDLPPAADPARTLITSAPDVGLAAEALTRAAQCPSVHAAAITETAIVRSPLGRLSAACSERSQLVRLGREMRAQTSPVRLEGSADSTGSGVIVIGAVAQ